MAVAKIAHDKDCSPRTAFRVLAKAKLRKRSKREKLLAERMCFSSVIKPSDNWNIAKVHWPRIDDDPAAYGYIPGDLYANCLFYYARPGDLVVDPMAGSGMVHHVYLDCAVWTKGSDQPWEIDLRMFDLTPRGRYSSLIGQWDLCQSFPPVERAPDYVIIDPPYLGACRGQYSRRADDLANMAEAEWTEAMHSIARNCAAAGARRCTIIVPTWVDTDKEHVVLCPEIVRAAWRETGYRLGRLCYASKRIQATRTDRMPWLNNQAKRTKVPLSDIAEVLTFDLSRRVAGQ